MIRVLAIDDEPHILNLYVRLLKGRGFEVETTTDPGDGLKRLRENPPDLLLLDVVMPGMTGFELFGEFKTAIRNIPVLFITGYPATFNAQNSDVAGMWRENFADGRTDILYKPFEPARFYAKIEALLGCAQGGGPC